MNSLKKFSTVLAMLGLAAFIGCTDEAPSDLPKAGLGGVTISKYVAVETASLPDISRAASTNPLRCTAIRISLPVS